MFLAIRRFLITAAAAVVLLSSASPLLFSQATGNIRGTVVDTSGAVIAGANVTATNLATSAARTVVTNQEGIYVFPDLAIGTYSLLVGHDGFETKKREGIELLTGHTVDLPIELAVGNASESVEVTTAAPLIQTTSSSVQVSVDRQQIQDLPLNGRNALQLTVLTPGTALTSVGTESGQQDNVGLTVNGLRATQNNFQLDGAIYNDRFFDSVPILPNPDALQEFTIQSANYGAQYGGAGALVQLSTRSGTNQIHGSAYEFLRNTVLDAKNYFQQTIPPFKLNQFGGTVGAPLVLPKVYNGRDRTFYFLDYQGSRRIQGTPYTALVPTDLQKQGVFGSVNIYNPFTTTPVGTTEQRQQFSYMGVANTIPPNMIDPVAAAIQKYFPEPNLTGVTGKNFTSSAPSIVNQDIFSTRLDQSVTRKYHLFGRYAYSSSALTQPNAFGNIADTEGAVGTTILRNQSFAFDNIYTLTPSLVLSVDYGYARWFQSRQTLSYGFDITQLGLPASLASAVTIKMFPTILIGGGFVGTNNQSYLSNGNDSHSLLASATKVAGKHTIVAGVDGRLHRINFFNVAASTGSYSFAIAQTQGAPLPRHQPLHDGHAEPGAVGLGARGVHAVERPRDQRHLILGYAGPAIHHR